MKVVRSLSIWVALSAGAVAQENGEVPPPPLPNGTVVDTPDPNATVIDLPEPPLPPPLPNGTVVDTPDPNATLVDLPSPVDPNGTDIVVADPNVTDEIVPSSAPTEEFVPPECWTNTTALKLYLKGIKDFFTPITVELCSNTVFEVGFVGDLGELCCIDGMSPLITRSNTKVRCGPDGDPANNCVFVGGFTQFFQIWVEYRDYAVNYVVEGVTFRDAAGSAVVMANGGQVTFINCIFEYHKGNSIFQTLNTAPLSAADDGRRLVEEITGVKIPTLNEEDEADRQLQASAASRLQYTVEGCVFQHNMRSDAPPNPVQKDGIVSIDTQFDDAKFSNCIFRNNSFAQEGKVRGYAILMTAGSTLEMTRNCFIGNDFVGTAPVLLASEEDLIGSEGNHGDGLDQGLACDYIAFGTSQTFECKDFEADTCFLTGSNGDTTTTGEEPVEEPAEEPVEEAPTSGAASRWSALAWLSLSATMIVSSMN